MLESFAFKHGQLFEGKYSRIFSNSGIGRLFSSREVPSKGVIRKLAESMFIPLGGNAGFTAGYTYIGQFVDHDVSRIEKRFELLPKWESNIRLGRTPSVDLDSVYGGGFDVLPNEALDRSTGMLIIGNDEAGEPNDLPRCTETGLAHIPDDRNDENLIIAQLHVAFLKLHNLLVLKSKESGPKKKFDEAKYQLTAIYQHLVLHDFLEKIAIDRVYAQVVGPVKKNEANTIQIDYLPLEFIGAAYRFGHSTVLESYRINDLAGSVPLEKLLSLVGGRDITKSCTLPSDAVVDWRHFFGDSTQFASTIDTALSRPLEMIRSNVSLAKLNLQSGYEMRLPSGQAMALELQERAVREEWDFAPYRYSGSSYLQRSTSRTKPIWESLRCDVVAPAWHYVLHEAKLSCAGKTLGDLGSWIVCKTILDLIHQTPNSVLTASGRQSRDLGVDRLWDGRVNVDAINFGYLLEKSGEYNQKCKQQEY